MKKGFLLLIAFSTLPACSSMYTMVNSFDSTAISWANLPGENIIKGSALIRQKGGGVVTCAGEKIYLTPASEYSEERMSVLYGSTEKGYIDNLSTSVRINSTPIEYLNSSIESVCDAQGYFEFSNIANGTYYATTTIEWVVNSEIFKEGGTIMQRVTVNNGQTKSIVLSP